MRPVLQFLPIAFKKKSVPTTKDSTMNLRFCQVAARLAALPCLAVLLALPAAAQSVDMFPASPENGQQEVWTRVAIPPDHPVSQVAQWHIDTAKKQIVCDGNGGHEWLRFNHELTNFSFRVKWRFTPVEEAEPEIQFRRVLPEQSRRLHLAPGSDLPSRRLHFRVYAD